ncbi:response regulator [Nonlabens sp. YIK11]|uniref:response regulator n=1 Tax=Nonlabens sp. YIK11 TaxID=1453349 RepID=UPI0006DC9CCD|nr:response regulator [Nonlabens sp. YIK11]
MTGEQEVLIFLDINMPEMNGWQFLEALKNVRYNFPIQVAIVTSSIDPEDQKRSSTYDMVTTLLTKPVAANELQDMLQSK